MPLLFLDTETTDKTPNSRLIQLAYKDTATGETFNEYFSPPAGITISFGAMAIHHITPKMLAGKPEFQGSPAQTRLQELLKDHILVAHNAPFDAKILANEAIPVDPARTIDTLRVSKHLIPDAEQYGLQYLRYALNLDGSLDAAGPPAPTSAPAPAPVLAHNAQGDVTILESLFDHLGNEIQKQFTLSGTEEILKKMLELTQTPVLLKTINFGKHFNKTFQEVAVTDRGYLEWLSASESKKPKADQNEELLYTLGYYLEAKK